MDFNACFWIVLCRNVYLVMPFYTYSSFSFFAKKCSVHFFLVPSLFPFVIGMLWKVRKTLFTWDNIKNVYLKRLLPPFSDIPSCCFFFTSVIKLSYNRKVGNGSFRFDFFLSRMHTHHTHIHFFDWHKFMGIEMGRTKMVNDKGGMDWGYLNAYDNNT